MTFFNFWKLSDYTNYTKSAKMEALVYCCAGSILFSSFDIFIIMLLSTQFSFFGSNVAVLSLIFICVLIVFKSVMLWHQYFLLRNRWYFFALTFVVIGCMFCMFACSALIIIAQSFVLLVFFITYCGMNALFWYDCYRRYIISNTNDQSRPRILTANEPQYIVYECKSCKSKNEATVENVEGEESTIVQILNPECQDCVCAVCLESMHDAEVVKTQCEHFFHLQCFHELQKREFRLGMVQCPLCRTDNSTF